jgi:hypothetical protein
MTSGVANLLRRREEPRAMFLELFFDLVFVTRHPPWDARSGRRHHQANERNTRYTQCSTGAGSSNPGSRSTSTVAWRCRAVRVRPESRRRSQRARADDEWTATPPAAAPPLQDQCQDRTGEDFPLEVAVGGRQVVLTTGRLRTLFAVLALSIAVPSSVERLADALRGEDRRRMPGGRSRRTSLGYARC